MSTRDELRREEATVRRDLNRALVADIPRDPAEVQKVVAKLRKKADNVLRLRTRVFHEDAHRVAERRAILADRIREEQAKEQERKARQPGRRAIDLLRTFADPELRGVSLQAERLSVAECEELLELVQARADGTITSRKRRRMERLVGVAADDPGLYARAREARETQERQEAEQARARLDRGPVSLPALLGEWLFDRRPGTLDVGDLAVLAAILFGLERGESPFVASKLSEGVIVLEGGQAPQLLPRLNNGAGVGRIGDSLRYLADLDLIELGTTEDGRTTIGRGERISQGGTPGPVT